MISLFLSRFPLPGFFALLIPALVFAALSLSSVAHADEEIVEKGQAVFNSKGCVACHSIGKGKITGPDLLGVTERREEEWLRQWLKSPDTMIYTDPIAKEMLKEYLVPMPNQGLSDEEIDILVEYFEYEDSKQAKK